MSIISDDSLFASHDVAALVVDGRALNMSPVVMDAFHYVVYIIIYIA